MTVEQLVHMASPHENSLPLLSEEQQSAILWQLDIILRCPSFRRSSRYPSMLEYCVRHTIAGNLEELRERHIGMTLFSRPPSYDTSADPIVRMAAGEIRKRLAQFYDDAGDDVSVKISLPPGSYVAEFRFLDPMLPTAEVVVAPDQELFRQQDQVATAPLPSADPLDVVEPVPRRVSLFSPAALLSIAGLLLLSGFLGYRLWYQSLVPAFWQGALEGASGQVLLVAGQLPVHETAQPNEPDPPLQTDIFRANRFISIGDASSAIAVCSTISRSSLNCQLKPAASVDLSNMQKRPAILLGAYNNPWTLRIGAPLPYRFGPLSCKCIVDAKSGNTVGGVDFSIPRDKISMDYSIVARFRSEITDGPTVIIAGVGPMSTEAAAEFASSTKRSNELLSLAPKGWKGGNVEAVLETDVVNGIPGHTRILRTAFW